MTEPLPDVWATRDLPVLREAVRRIDEQAGLAVYTDEVKDVLGIDRETVDQACYALQVRGLLSFQGSVGGRFEQAQDPSAEAYMLTGLHPNGDDAVTQLIEMLRQAAEQTNDPAERSRLRALADTAGGVSRSVLAGVLTTLTTGAVT